MHTTNPDRITVLKQIDNLFTTYCHVCPYFGHDHVNCNHCPISGQLQEHGRSLGWESLKNPSKSTAWTEKEDEFLWQYRQIMTAKQIAERLGRTKSSVQNRYNRLKRGGRNE